MELRSIEAVVCALNAAGVRYLIVAGDSGFGNSIAAGQYFGGSGGSRWTWYAPRIPVPAEQFADLALRESWRAEKGMLVFQLHSELHRMTPIDVFVYEPFDFDAEYELAVADTVVPGTDARIVGLEAFFKMKRTANRSKNLVDLDALQKIAPYKK